MNTEYVVDDDAEVRNIIHLARDRGMSDKAIGDMWLAQGIIRTASERSRWWSFLRVPEIRQDRHL